MLSPIDKLTSAERRAFALYHYWEGRRPGSYKIENSQEIAWDLISQDVCLACGRTRGNHYWGHCSRDKDKLFEETFHNKTLLAIANKRFNAKIKGDQDAT